MKLFFALLSVACISSSMAMDHLERFRGRGIIPAHAAEATAAALIASQASRATLYRQIKTVRNNQKSPSVCTACGKERAKSEKQNA